ncbi:MAG: ribonuclease P protein component [Firmicutes bacterium]|nr:ribonuclease P protein component [Bacillota bacterium]
MLPAQYRLKAKGDFRRVYNRGQVKACGAFILYVGSGKNKNCRIGFSVSKKVGNAVTRNRLKRLFRHSAYALIGKFQPRKNYVFVIRNGAKPLNQEQIKEQMDWALSALHEGSVQERAGK